MAFRLYKSFFYSRNVFIFFKEDLFMTDTPESKNVADFFGCNVFNDRVMRERLPKDVYRAVRNTKKLGCPLAPEIAGAVAHAMKEWAIEKGATHYTHDRRYC